MIIVNQSTNSWVGGVRVPVGSSEFPFAGDVQIYTSGWGPTNVYIGSGDTLSLWEEGYAISEGYGLFETWAAFFYIGLVGFGTIGFARRMVRWLVAPQSPWNL